MLSTKLVDPLAFCAVTVNEVVALAVVGVPEMSPLDGLMVSPVGRLGDTL